MRKAIHTKYAGPTNTRGSRIIARCCGASVSRGYSHDLNADGNHTMAAKALVEKQGWTGLYVGGGNPDGRGYCYVHMSDDLAHAPLGRADVDWFHVEESVA